MKVWRKSWIRTSLWPPRAVCGGRAMTHPNRQITLQRRHNGGVQGHVPGLAELRVPNRQDSKVEIQIAAVQMERFRQSQTRGGDQPEDRRVCGRAQSNLERNTPGGGKKVADLPFRIDVRREAAVGAAKDCGLGK